MNMYSDENCITALQQAARKLGGSFSRSEYDSLDLSPSSITIRRRFDGWNNALKTAGIEPVFERKSVNVDYFKSIDIPEKAYWLGVLYGDGTVSADRPRVALNVSIRDSELVSGFSQALDSTYAITTTERENDTMVTTQIYDSEFVQSLGSVGLNPQKTHSDVLPEIEPDLFPHFSRGLSDADGHFGYHRGGKVECRWVLTGSPGRMAGIADRLPVGVATYEVNGSAQLRVGKQRELIPLIEWLYPEGNETAPALERKRETAIKIHQYASN